MMNSFLAIGRIHGDADLDTEGVEPVTVFTLAVERSHCKGERHRADLIPCSISGERARALAPYLTKGTQVGVSGRLESDGDHMEVACSEVNFLVRPAAPVHDKEAVPA